MTPPQNNKNLILAILLSTGVIFLWNFFFTVPQMRQKAQEAKIASMTLGEEEAVSGVEALSGVSEVLTKETAPSPRIFIKAPALKGSIALRGSRIDAVSLKKYKKTPNADSDVVSLFSPRNAASGYYADFGWITPKKSDRLRLGLPDKNSLWKGSGVLTPDAPLTLTYESPKEALTFKRTISIDDAYMFTIIDRVENRTSSPVSLASYGRITRIGTPKTSGVAVQHEGFIGYLGEERLQEISYGDMDEDKSKKFESIDGGWLGFTDKYWASALIPDQTTPYDAAFTARNHNYEAIALSPARSLSPGETLTRKTLLFTGAKEVSTLDAYETKYGIKKFELMIDWGIFHFITRPLFTLIDAIYDFAGNFGLAILLVTVLIKLALYPLANKSFRSMARMKEVQPQITELKERFKGDSVKQQQAMMALYKKYNLNPVAGCLPSIVQIPVFFALYKVLYTTIEMRHAPFFGWIKDLSSADPSSIFNLFGILPFTPPSLGFLDIGFWPIVMGGTMWLQMRMSPASPDPIQRRIFMWMPLIFTFMMAQFPVGLVLYWTCNNILSIGQQSLINFRMKNEKNPLKTKNVSPQKISDAHEKN